MVKRLEKNRRRREREIIVESMASPNAIALAANRQSGSAKIRSGSNSSERQERQAFWCRSLGVSSRGKTGSRINATTSRPAQETMNGKTMSCVPFFCPLFLPLFLLQCVAISTVLICTAG